MYSSLFIGLSFHSKDAMARVYFYRSWRRRYFAKNLTLIRPSFRLTLIVEILRCVCCAALLLLPELFPFPFPPLPLLVEVPPLSTQIAINSRV